MLCPNPFKGTLSASAAAKALASGLARAGWTVEALPLADGGPGTLDALRVALGGRVHRERVDGPLGMRLRAGWLELPGRAAVVESAQAIGLERCPTGRLDPLAADSRGLGQLLLAVHAAGARTVWVGLGGSATTDGGAGMARALGWRFLDAQGRDLPAGGGALRALDRVLPPPRDMLKGLRIRVLCDVDNPLYGPRGAAEVYGPQKGARPAQVRRLDEGLRLLAKSAPRQEAPGGGSSLALLSGAGAAGGLGFGLCAFARGRLVRGAPAILKLVSLRRRLRRADWVLTGEGCLDRQTLAGKLPSALARAARAAGKPCLVVCGVNRLAGRELRRAGFSAVLAAPGDGPAAAAVALRAAAFSWGRAALTALRSVSIRPRKTE